MNSVINIAIADDHTLVRSGFINLIRQQDNYCVTADAENGKQLINKILLLNTPPNVCIVDISMPVLNGYDTVVKLKGIYPEMKFLALTFSGEEYSIIKMILSGANGYLLKNVTQEELIKAIHTVHTNGYYYSPTASFKLFSEVKKNTGPKISDKELQFLQFCCSGIPYRKMAVLMCVSIRTIEGYHKNLSEKLKLNSRSELMLFAIQTGLVSINDITLKNIKSNGDI